VLSVTTTTTNKVVDSANSAVSIGRWSNLAIIASFLSFAGLDQPLRTQLWLALAKGTSGELRIFGLGHDQGVYVDLRRGFLTQKQRCSGEAPCSKAKRVAPAREVRPSL
jgi:hypothetical protein